MKPNWDMVASASASSSTIPSPEAAGARVADAVEPSLAALVVLGAILVAILGAVLVASVAVPATPLPECHDG